MNSLPDKLEDCTIHGNGSELLIVEGDSASRAIKRVRFHQWQAILPMQGKPMNATKASLVAIKDNIEFAALLASLGIELGDDLDLNQIRYEHIVLLFDPDADGIHGRTLMLLFFYHCLRPLLDAGRIFDTHAPLWAVSAADLDHPLYAFSDDHLKRIRQALAEQGVVPLDTRRFRGLGNVDGIALRGLCLDPKSRRLQQLTADDAENAIALFAKMRAQ